MVLGVESLSSRVSSFKGLNDDPATKKTSKTMIDFEANGDGC